MASETPGRAGGVTAAVCAAALGAAFGDLLFTAILAGLSNPSGLIAIALAAPLMYLASRHFLDPFAETIRSALTRSSAAPRPDAPKGRWLRALAVGCAVLSVWAANVLGDYAQAHPAMILATILVSVAVVGSITLAWILGTRSAVPLSGILGGFAGFAVNTLATIAVLAWNGVPATPEVVAASAASGTSVGLAALAGGLVVDTGLARRPALGATLAALLVFAATALIGGWLSGNVSADYILPNIMLGLGWMLGLSSSRSANSLLRRRPIEARAVA
jgi:hypothetical protein